MYSKIGSLTSFLNRKSIVVVGNGEIKGAGKEIDLYDVVIRFNNYEIEGYEEDVGTKTIVWAHARSTDVKKRDSKVDGFMFELLPRPYRRIKGNIEDNSLYHFSDLNLTVGCIKAYKRIPVKHPSSGIEVLSYLLQKSINSSLFHSLT